PFAKEFSVVLQEDETLQRLISGLFLEFSLNNQFLLTIKNIAPVAEVVAPETAASEEAADTMDKEPEEITSDTEG
ncbi:MAG: hypothetical protein H7X88_13105, partial [Gloeobacteraceae cyanobacterium ES-bin-316]|nr:hypothetical protein [Ferruginibacter sp.]